MSAYLLRLASSSDVLLPSVWRQLLSKTDGIDALESALTSVLYDVLRHTCDARHVANLLFIVDGAMTYHVRTWMQIAPALCQALSKHVHWMDFPTVRLFLRRWCKQGLLPPWMCPVEVGADEKSALKRSLVADAKNVMEDLKPSADQSANKRRRPNTWPPVPVNGDVEAGAERQASPIFPTHMHVSSPVHWDPSHDGRTCPMCGDVFDITFFDDAVMHDGTRGSWAAQGAYREPDGRRRLLHLECTAHM